MTIPEHLKFTVRRFSARRVGYLLAAVSFALVPAHFYVSCDMSGLIAGFDAILLLSTAVLSFAVPRGTPQRFRPVAFAFLAFIAHSLCTH